MANILSLMIHSVHVHCREHHEFYEQLDYQIYNYCGNVFLFNTKLAPR